MKLLGLSCGRKMGNSEVLLKEALMGAEESGVEVEILRLMDMTIKPCIGCAACLMSLLKGGPGTCVIKDDDVPFFDEALLSSDGIIISVPAYISTPPGYFKVLGDRMGPSHDVGYLKLAKEMTGDPRIDDRFFRPRVAGSIGVGGAGETHMRMTLPLIKKSFIFSMGIKVVDQFIATRAANPGEVVLNKDAIARARMLGRNVARELGKPLDQVKYWGEPGICPECHGHFVMVKSGRNPVECPLCGAPGTLKIDGDTISFVVDQERLNEAVHASWQARKADYEYKEKTHTNEKRDFKVKNEEIRKAVDKYKNYKSISLPPSKAHNRSEAVEE